MINLFLILFILIRVFSNPIANVFQKKLSVDCSSVVINLYTYLFLSIVCLFNLHILSGYNFTTEFVVLVLTCGFLCTMGMVCMIKAVNIGELSVLGPINSYKSIISLIIAFFLLKEIPSIQGLIGVCFIVFGSKYIFEMENNKLSLEILKRKDIQLRFAAMTLTGLEAVFLKKIILISSVEICFMFWCFTGFLWSLILFISSKHKSLLLKNTSIKTTLLNYFFIVIIAICLGLMQYSTNYVFARMNVGFALAIFQLSSIVTVLFGYQFFHEHNIKKKLLGCLIMITGSCLIIFG